VKQLKQFQALYPGYEIIFLHISGSRLYGIALPDSDTDYRGIFAPSLEDLILKRDLEHWTSSTGGKNAKNSKDDIDVSLWSVHKFLKLIQVGDTNAMDTLFAYGSHAEILRTSLMDKIHKQRETFFPENLRSFFGYALSQVKTYSIKGDKLKTVQELREAVTRMLRFDGGQTKISTIRDLQGYIETSDNVQWVTDDNNTYIKVIGKRFIQTVHLSEFLDKLTKIEGTYGARAKATKDNQSVDWKALYHAFRVILESKELMTSGHIVFPLKHSKFLLKIRNQEYSPQECFEMLELLYNETASIEKTNGNYLKSITRGDADSLLLEYYANL